jgi:hypothetical protein
MHIVDMYAFSSNQVSLSLLETTPNSEVQRARKMGRPGNKYPATDLGEFAGKQLKRHVPEFPNTTFMVVICGVPNGSNDPTFSLQLEASFKDVRH